MIKTIFFDLDDTLYSFEGSQAKLMAEHEPIRVISEILDQDFQITQDDFLFSRKKLQQENEDKSLKYSRFFWYQTFLQEQGIKDDNLAKEMEDLYWSTMAENIVPSIDTKWTLSQLADYDLFIITNGLEHGQRIRIKALGIDEHFEEIICSDNSGGLKPNQLVFDYALEIAGCRPEQAIMVGDKPQKDIRGANQAGMISVLIGPTDFGDDKPDYAIKTLGELPMIVRGLQ